MVFLLTKLKPTSLAPAESIAQTGRFVNVWGARVSAISLTVTLGILPRKVDHNVDFSELNEFAGLSTPLWTPFFEGHYPQPIVVLSISDLLRNPGEIVGQSHLHFEPPPDCHSEERSDEESRFS